MFFYLAAASDSSPESSNPPKRKVIPPGQRILSITASPRRRDFCGLAGLGNMEQRADWPGCRSIGIHCGAGMAESGGGERKAEGGRRRAESGCLSDSRFAIRGGSYCIDHELSLGMHFYRLIIHIFSLFSFSTPISSYS